MTGVEQLRTAETVGRILAEPVMARRSNPPLPNSAVDGYGFAFAATGAAGGDDEIDDCFARFLIEYEGVNAFYKILMLLSDC